MWLKGSRRRRTIAEEGRTETAAGGGAGGGRERGEGRCRSRDQKLVERTQIPADYGAGKWSKALGVYGYNAGPGGIKRWIC